KKKPETIVAFRQGAAVGWWFETLGAVSFTNLFSNSSLIARLPNVQFTLLVDGCVEEETEQHRRRSIDGHRHRRSRVSKVETAVQTLRIVETTDGDTRVADLSVNIRPVVRVVTVKRNRVKRCRQPPGGHVFAEIMESAICSFRSALTGKHPRRVFRFALERIDAGRVGKFAGHVFSQQPLQEVTPAFVPGYGNLGNASLRQ